MEHIIRLLPDAIANQIAAGEVVQRPASVVKELLENAIDAKASEIVLQVKEGGKTFIQVVDNGKGMSETDARMCFERHATSKIALFEDMQKLRTFGFRGEALASIAAVAQVELKTRQTDAEIGTLLKVEASDLKVLEPVATEQGSSFTIKNLFFNVPARRNFLKSNQIELSHISEEFNRVALAYPEIGFSYYQAGALILKTASANMAKRISSVFGEAYRDKILPVEEEVDFLKVTGFIGKPEISKKNRGEQYFFANRRYIKNGYLHHAVSTAFEGLLPASHFPFYALYLELDPAKIDINVHPTKTEIKFENERFVYSVIQAAVRKALQMNVMVPALDFEPPSPWLNQSHSFAQNTLTERRPNASSNSGFGSTPWQNPSPNPANSNNWEKLYTAPTRDNSQIISQFENNGLRSEDQIENPGLNFDAKEKFSIVEKTMPFNLHGKFLMAQVKSGMLLIHMQRAWERITYERYLSQIENRNSASQQLLFPKTIDFSPQDFSLLLELDAEIRALGLDWEPFGGHSILLIGLPADLSNFDPVRLFQDFFEQCRWNQKNLKLPNNQSIARALSKRNAQQQSFHHWRDSELNDLVNQLFACQVPNFTPDQLPVSKVFAMQDIENWLE